MTRPCERRSRTVLLECVLLLAFCLILLLHAVLRDRHANPAVYDSAGGLGMVFVDILDEDSASSYHVDRLGVYVLAVREDSEAYLAGVRSGDRMVSVNGISIGASAEFTQMQEAFLPSQMMNIAFERGNTADLLQVQLSWMKGEMQP